MSLLCSQDHVLDMIRRAYLSSHSDEFCERAIHPSLTDLYSGQTPNQEDELAAASLGGSDGLSDEDEEAISSQASAKLSLGSLASGSDQALGGFSATGTLLTFDEDSEFEQDMVRAAQEVKLSTTVSAAGASRKNVRQRISLESLSKPPLIMRSRQGSQVSIRSSPSVENFHKVIPREIPQKSQLSDLLNGNGGDGDSLEQFKEAASRTDQPIHLKFYFPNKFSSKVDVNIDCTVHMAIGYCILKNKGSVDEHDVNRWNVYLAEDDGEPDEDFPPLDRTRPIGSYSAEEYALVKASESEYKDNCRITPMRQCNQKGQQRLSYISENVHIRIFTYPYDELFSSVYWENFVPRGTRLSEVFFLLCREKSLDTDMYVLRAVNSDKKVTSGTEVVQPPDTDFEVTPIRSLGPARENKIEEERNTPAQKKKPSQVIMPMQPLGFYKYRVWRRQQVSFRGRNERELAIDGENIHIMPSSERRLNEVPKTTSFNIKQVLKVKQSLKIPTNFKVLVMKPNGPKRYDLEAESSDIAEEIVERIKSLRERK